MTQYRYEVLAEFYWDGTQLRKQGEVFTVTAEEPLKIAAPNAFYKPSLKLLKDEEESHPAQRGRKPKGDEI